MLLPYVLLKMNIRQFFHWKFVVVAMLGGLGYAMLAYVGFSLAPAAHGAIFLHGFLPFWTAPIVTHTITGCKQGVQPHQNVSVKH